MNKGKIYEIRFPGGKIKLLDGYGGEFQIQLDNSSIQSDEKDYQPPKDTLSTPSQPNSEEKECNCKTITCYKNCPKHKDCKVCHSPKPEGSLPKIPGAKPRTKEEVDKIMKPLKDYTEAVESFNDTSNEWEVGLPHRELLQNELTPEQYEYLIEYISSLLSQSEQRVRKEILKKVKDRYTKWWTEAGSCNKSDVDDLVFDFENIINLISK